MTSRYLSRDDNSPPVLILPESPRPEGSFLYKRARPGTVALPGSILRRRGAGWAQARKFGSGNSANTGGKYCFIALFLEKKHFKRILTVQFSGPVFCAKMLTGCWLSGRARSPGARYGPKLNRLSWWEKGNCFSGKNTGICRCIATRGGPVAILLGDHATVSDFLCR